MTTPNDATPAEMALPVGTRIRFTKTLIEGPDEDSPARQYAARGQLGEITGHGTREGYWAKADGWPNAFGVSRNEFEVVAPAPPAEPPAAGVELPSDDFIIHRTSDKMPRPFHLVIVSGGVAIWDGINWRSQTGDASGRPIEWPVKWWAELRSDVEPPAIDVVGDPGGEVDRGPNEKETTALSNVKDTFHNGKPALAFLRRLATERGAIVSSAECTPQEIGMAQAAGRMWVDPATNYGYVLRSHAAEPEGQLQTVHQHVKEALELLGVDVSIDGYIPDSWTLREQCHIAGKKLATLTAKLAEVEAALTESRKGWVERITFAVHGPHTKSEECPTWYDQCNCGIVKRLEADIDRLREAVNCVLCHPAVVDLPEECVAYLQSVRNPMPTGKYRLYKIDEDAATEVQKEMIQRATDAESERDAALAREAALREAMEMIGNLPPGSTKIGPIVRAALAATTPAASGQGVSDG